MDRFSIILILAFLLPISLVFGEGEDDLFIIPRLSEPIVFDGKLDENAWESLSPLTVTMFTPNHGHSPSEKSEIFITYDDEFIYLAARLYYSNGTKMISKSKKRDPSSGGNDYLGIMFDSFNDNENGLGFETSPAGLRSDFSVENDGQSNLRMRIWNRSWNTFWDVKTIVEEDIWHVEIRIPFSSLRFQDDNGRVIMGMTIWRYIVDRQEFDVYPLMTNDFGFTSIWKPSLSQKVVFEGVFRKNPIYITPYVLAGLEQESELNESQSGYNLNSDHKLTAGLDVKYALTSNLTMDLTLNTDFAQVEADEQMVNLTRFSLFFPEKRQFFLERSSIFTIKTGYMDQLFYSRRIGLHEGEIVPIIGGARLAGRSGKWDLGFLNMQTTSHDYIDEDTDQPTTLPSTNHGVYRLRKQVLNPKSYAGGMVTSQIDVNGNYNVNAALDGIINLFGTDYLTANYAQTFDSDVSINNDIIDHAKFYINWENRSDVGFSYDFLVSRAGPHYNPEMGFEMMDDYSRVFGMLSYGWVNNDENKKMLRHQVSAFSWLNKRNSDMETDISMTNMGWSFSTKTGYRGSFMLSNAYQNLAYTFELSDDVYFPSGSYHYNTLEGSISTPSNKLFSLRAG